MLRRLVLSIVAVALCSLLTVSAQEAAKPDRLSGVVREIDKSGMKITMSPRNDANARRVILFDSSTKFMLSEKPASIDDVKEGMGIVAIGKFEGVQLKATNITVRLR